MDVGDRSDLELLAAYRQTGSESAFAELTRRHVNLVFGAALRKTGCRELAEEVVQQVFILLARKGRQGMTMRSTLAGWLYQATLNEGAHLLRTERRHQRRNARYLEEETIRRERSSPGDRVELEVLDEALNTLKPADRGAVLAHYYEGKTYAEMAADIGKTPEACRKQCSRAVERLSQWLNSRQRMATHSTVIVALAALGAEEARASLAGNVSLQAMASAEGGAAAAGAATTWASVASVVFGIGLPFLVMWPVVAARFEQQSETVFTAPAVSVIPNTRNDPARFDGNLRGLDLRWLAKEFTKPRHGADYPRSTRLEVLMGSLSLKQLLAFAEICSEGRKDFEHPAWPSILLRWGELDPLDALEQFKFDTFLERYSLEQLRQGLRSPAVQRIGYVLKGWAASDPDSLVSWCLAGDEKHQHFVAFHAHLVAVSPSHAIQLGQRLGEPGKLLVSGGVTAWAKRQPEVALQWITSEFESEEAISLAFIAGLGTADSLQSSLVFANWLQPVEQSKALEVLVKGFRTRARWNPGHAFDQLAELPGNLPPHAVLQYLFENPYENKNYVNHSILRAAMRAWRQWEPEAAEAWLLEHGESFGTAFEDHD